VRGPYLVVAPLSTLCNWRREFQRWAPDIPVILYHGSPDERGVLREGIMDPDSKLNSFCTVITSYEIIMNDRRHLQVRGLCGVHRVRAVSDITCAFEPCCVVFSHVLMPSPWQNLPWKYIVVDEGHRLKNLNCRLIRELKCYQSANRLLLTGTPLQVACILLGVDSALWV
jgi:ATP-dependent DNA helicase